MADNERFSGPFSCAGVYLYDMHCHLDFAPQPGIVAHKLNELGVRCFSVTVTPEDYMSALRLMEGCNNVCVGLGLHPWWAEKQPIHDKALEHLKDMVSRAPLIGEVGLDFGNAHKHTRDIQCAIFECILAACAGCESKKVISIHAVHAADTVLDMLEQYDVSARHACIFHWFSGSSNELQRAIKQGCYFSVGPHMLASKRGRAYAQAIPQNRLLLETDSPAHRGDVLPALALRDALAETLCAIARLRRADAKEVMEQVTRTSEALFDIPTRLNCGV